MTSLSLAPLRRLTSRLRATQTALAVLLLLLPAAGAAEDEQNRPLVVYGDAFMFMVREPAGWTADLENAPKLSASVLLLRAGETFERHGIVMAVRVAQKVDEDTRADLSHDMREFRRLYPDVQFKDLQAPHPSYASQAKLFAIPRSRHDYVTYLNPGAGVPFLFSVTMMTGKKEAGKTDLQAYRDAVRSIEFIPQGKAAPLR